MSKNVAYTADFDIRADFTVLLFMSSDSDIKFGNTATMSLANMMGECLKGMYESVTVEGCGEEFSTDLFNEHEITHCPYCGCRFRNPRQN